MQLILAVFAVALWIGSIIKQDVHLLILSFLVLIMAKLEQIREEARHG